MARPHLARRLEDGWNRRRSQFLSERGWQPRIVPFHGYGGADFLRVRGRLLLTPATDEPRPVNERDQRRGWRNFVTAELPGAVVTLTIGDTQFQVRTDNSGHIDSRLPNPGLPAGRQHVDAVVSTPGAAPGSERSSTALPVFVVPADATFGLVSDIDDTVIKTYLPTPLRAAYYTFVLTERSRRPVAGMAQLYGDLLHGYPDAPIFYLSTGAWNTAPTLVRFLRRHGFPAGPMLMTDWGPTATGWFRSGQQHKRSSLESLAADFPGISWVLIGDDGQHDPSLYAEFAGTHPDRVRAILIRQLTAVEQAAQHGVPIPLEGRGGGRDLVEVRAPDGAGLMTRLAAMAPGWLR